MGFMSGNTSNAPKRDQNALGVQTYRASSSESARPVPYLAGKQRFALTFISDVFDQKTSSVSSGGKGSTRSGYNYYASFAALACHGPVDALHAIYLNGDPVYASTTEIVIKTLTSVAGVATAQTKNAHNLNSGDSVVIVGAEQLEYDGTHIITVTDATHFTYPITGTPATPATTPGDAEIFCRVLLPPVIRDDANPDFVDITIPDYGVMRLYWGTETQLPDDYLQTSGVAHPSYRGLCYAVFHQLFLGFNQTNVQNIELVLARYPTTDWLAARNVNDDTSLVSVVADLLQNPRAGLGLDDSLLDTATLLATAAALQVEALGFSPIITREQAAQQLLVNALEYFDAYLSFTPADTLGIRLVRPPGGSGALATVTDSDLVEKPQFTPEDWSTSYNVTRIKFSNRLLDFKEDMLGRPDTGARSITQESNSQTLDRMWITDQAIATRLQQSGSRAAALPRIAGTMKLRMNAALFDALAPGQPFAFNYSLRHTGNIVWRVDQQTIPDASKPEFELSFHADRSYVYQVQPSYIAGVAGEPIEGVSGEIIDPIS